MKFNLLGKDDNRFYPLLPFSTCHFAKPGGELVNVLLASQHPSLQREHKGGLKTAK